MRYFIIIKKDKHGRKYIERLVISKMYPSSIQADEQPYRIIEVSEEKMIRYIND